MSEFLSLCISGAVSGAIVSIIASGIVLSFSTSGIFNFSHGAIAFSTAYVFFLLRTGLHWPVPAAAVVAIVLYAPLLGLALDWIVFRKLSRAPDAPRIIGTVGLLIAIPSLWLFIVETLLVDHLHVNLPKIAFVTNPAGLGPVPRRSWVIAESATIDSNQLIVFAAALASAIVLWVVVRHTRLGLLMRATVDHNVLASLRGVSPSQVSAVSWILSMLLAGVAGVVAAPVIGIGADNFNVVLFVAAGAAVIGGLRSIPIAFAGGLGLGVLQNVVADYGDIGPLARITGLRTAVPSLVLLVGLLTVSQRRRSAGIAVEGERSPDLRGDLPRWRRWAPWLVTGSAALIYTVFMANEYRQGLMAQAFALGVVFLSITTITGLGGIVSLAQGTFVTSAALLSAYLTQSAGVPVFLAMLLGVGFAVTLGVVVALPSVNLDGLALTLSTLALAFVGSQVLFQIPALQNNGSGWFVDRPKIGPVDLGNTKVLATVILGVLCVGIWFTGNLFRSLWGRSMLSVRTSPAAARSVGIYPMRTKLVIFATCAAFAGIGGILLALVRQRITPDAFPATTSMTWVATVVIFGVRRPGGAFIAGIVSVMSAPLIDYATTSPYIPSILFGLGAVGMAAHPEGVMEQMADRRGMRRRRRSMLAAPIQLEELPVAPEPVMASTRRPGAARDADAALTVERLESGYGEVGVLQGVDLQVPRGSICLLLGANGAGKSTLCSTLAGTVRATAGTIVVNGHDVTRMPSHRRVRMGLALVPEGRGVFPGLTVDENLSLWLVKSADRKRVYEEFPLLARRRSQTGWNLSGGEQQILSLAPMLVRPPALLIADEPTLGLAPLVIHQVLQLLTRLRDEGVSILLVEEKAVNVVAVADQVALLQLGAVTWSGGPEQLDVSRVAETYLGTRITPV